MNKVLLICFIIFIFNFYSNGDSIHKKSGEINEGNIVYILDDVYNIETNDGIIEVKRTDVDYAEINGEIVKKNDDVIKKDDQIIKDDTENKEVITKDTEPDEKTIRNNKKYNLFYSSFKTYLGVGIPSFAIGSIMLSASIPFLSYYRTGVNFSTLLLSSAIITGSILDLSGIIDFIAASYYYKKWEKTKEIDFTNNDNAKKITGEFNTLNNISIGFGIPGTILTTAFFAIATPIYLSDPYYLKSLSININYFNPSYGILALVLIAAGTFDIISFVTFVGSKIKLAQWRKFTENNKYSMILNYNALNNNVSFGLKFGL